MEFTALPNGDRAVVDLAKLHDYCHRALLVEFSDEQGQTYAMVPVRPEQLLILHRGTEAA
jgi:hypothetical protein